MGKDQENVQVDFSYDYENNKNCSNCILLPVCMGGCTKQRLGLAPNFPEQCDQKEALKKTKDTIKKVYEFMHG